MVHWAVLEFLTSCIMVFTPGEAMAIGALVGLLPILFVAVKRRPHTGDDRAEGSEERPPELSPMSAHDRLLTCVICKRPVRMRGFAAHIASHDAEGAVSPPHPLAVKNGQHPHVPSLRKASDQTSPLA
jgi:hypothetical protein